MDRIGDLLIREDSILWIGQGELPGGGVDVINAAGLIVCPGFFDLHCHLREPGFESKETIATGTLAAARGGRLWCVFGCGGDRDATKRPLMGAIAARDADQVIVTSDNPRGEVPAAILGDIVAGIGAERSHVSVVEDRREAIVVAAARAAAADVILIAGKGHEDYQEIAGVKLAFSDVAQAMSALAQRAGA